MAIACQWGECYHESLVFSWRLRGSGGKQTDVELISVPLAFLQVLVTFARPVNACPCGLGQEDQ